MINLVFCHMFMLKVLRLCYIYLV